MPTVQDKWNKYTTPPEESGSSRWDKYTTPPQQFSNMDDAKSAMKKANLDQKIAEFQASPIGLAGQVLGGAANTITGGATGQFDKFLSEKVFPGVPQFSDEQSGFYGLGRQLGYIPLGAATAMGAGAVPGLAGKALMSKVGHGALSGAAAGAIGNYENRGAGAAIGGVTGAAIPLATAGVKAVGGTIGRVGRSFKGPSSADLETQLAQRKLDIQTEKEYLTKLFQKKSKNIISIGKKEIPRISKNMTEAYGKGLDDIFTRLEQPLEGSNILKKNAPPITNQEIVDQLDDLVNKASNDPLIVKSQAFSKVRGMLDYFKNGLKSPSGLVDESGNALKSQAPEAVDIRDLIGKTRDVLKTIKSGNTTPGTPDDYFANQFNGVVGKLLKSRINGFEELQSAYAPMANTRKVAYKLFKPMSDEASAQAFLNRVKNGNLNSADEKLLKFLESGGKIAGQEIKGVGNFSSDIVNIGNRIKEINSQKEIKELAVQMTQKAADEKFRNQFFTWLAAAAGLGGLASGIKHLSEGSSGGNK